VIHSLDACLNIRGSALSKSHEDLLPCRKAFGCGGFNSPPISDSSQVETDNGIAGAAELDPKPTEAGCS